MTITNDRLRAHNAATKFAKKLGRDTKIAVLGNNAGTLAVSGRDDRIWGLLDGDSSKLIQIERGTSTVEPVVGTPVLVELARKNAAYYRLVGRVTDWYANDPQTDTVRAHGWQHQREDFGAGGPDPVEVYKRMIPHLRARAQIPAGWTLYVEADDYEDYLGARVTFAGGNSPVFTKPAVAGQRRCDLLYFNTSHNLAILQGTLTVDGSIPTKPTQPDQTVAVAYVYLDYTMTAITEAYIFEARMLWHAISATAVAAVHDVFDAARHGDVVTVSPLVRGSLPYVNSTPKLATLAKGGAGTFPVWDANDLTVSKVTITQPATAATLTIADNKTATINNSVIISGTDGGAINLAVTNTKTLTLTATDNYNLTIPGTGIAVLGTGSAPVTQRVAFWTGANTLSYSDGFRFNSTLSNLTIGTGYGDPNYKIVAYDSALDCFQLIYSGKADGQAGFYVRNDAYYYFQYIDSSDDYGIFDQDGRRRWNALRAGYSALEPASGRKVAIGFLTAPSATLHIQGAADQPQLWTVGHTTQAVATPIAQITRNDTTAGVSAMLGLTALGSGANGDGGSILFNGKSSTTAAQAMGAIKWLWNDATHATRKADLVATAYDTAEREIWRGRGSGTAPMFSLYGGTPVVRGTALTTQLTTLTYTAPGTPDFAIQDLVDSSGGACFGFATKDEGNTVLSVIKNLQDRVAEIDARLNATTGINVWA